MQYSFGFVQVSSFYLLRLLERVLRLQILLRINHIKVDVAGASILLIQTRCAEKMSLFEIGLGKLLYLVT